MDTRRNVERVTLLEPLKAEAGGIPAYIANVSLDGIMVAHQQPIVMPGGNVDVSFAWEDHRNIVACEVRWTRVQRLARGTYARTMYHSGCVIREASEAARGVIREIVTGQVLRALDEQKANAHGISPYATIAIKSRTSDYRRHELRNGTWHVVATSEPYQPDNGFTIAAAIPQEGIRLLRETFERGNDDDRLLLRRMAALSIINEPLPVRRYTP